MSAWYRRRVRYSNADLDYIRANFATLEELCAGKREGPDEVRALIRGRLLPKPSYVLDDGAEMFPADYFRLSDEAGGPARLRQHFQDGLRATGCADVDGEWESYLSGIYGVCLRAVTPETIVRKGELVASLGELLVLATPDDPGWRRRLREQVEELDALEREFSPDYDRDVPRFGRPPTRDLLIEGPRQRYPEVFAATAAG